MSSEAIENHGIPYVSKEITIKIGAPVDLMGALALRGCGKSAQGHGGPSFNFGAHGSQKS